MCDDGPWFIVYEYASEKLTARSYNLSALVGKRNEKSAGRALHILADEGLSTHPMNKICYILIGMSTLCTVIVFLYFFATRFTLRTKFSVALRIHLYQTLIFIDGPVSDQNIPQ